eukprot:5026906-Prymnesium_polylepis.1
MLPPPCRLVIFNWPEVVSNCVLDSAAHAACRTASTNDESGMGIKVMRSGVLAVWGRCTPELSSASASRYGLRPRARRCAPQRKLMPLIEAPESAALRHKQGTRAR